MNYMFIWFISGVIMMLSAVPITIFGPKVDDKHQFTPTMAFMVVLLWGFIGALFVRGYDAGFWYMASVFTLSTLAAAFKKKSQDEIPVTIMPYALWMILGLVIPFIVGTT